MRDVLFLSIVSFLIFYPSEKKALEDLPESVLCQLISAEYGSDLLGGVGLSDFLCFLSLSLTSVVSTSVPFRSASFPSSFHLFIYIW